MEITSAAAAVNTVIAVNALEHSICCCPEVTSDADVAVILSNVVNTDNAVAPIAFVAMVALVASAVTVVTAITVVTDATGGVFPFLSDAVEYSVVFVTYIVGITACNCYYCYSFVKRPQSVTCYRSSKKVLLA